MPVLPAKKRKSSVLPTVAGTLGALALGTYGLRRAALSDDELKLMQGYVDQSEADKALGANLDPMVAAKHYYQHAADVQQNVRPFGLDATKSMIALRSSPLAPEEYKVTEFTRQHYDQTQKSPLHANLHILTEAADLVGGDVQAVTPMDGYLRDQLSATLDLAETIRKAKVSDFTRHANKTEGVAAKLQGARDATRVHPWIIPERLQRDPAALQRMSDVMNQRVQAIMALPGATPKNEDYAGFSQRISAARDVWMDQNKLTEQAMRKLPIEQQTAMIDQFDTWLAKEDPTLYKQKALADVSSGLGKMDWADYYPKMVYKPALQTAKIMDYAALGLGVGAAGVLAVALILNQKKRKQRESNPQNP